MDFKYIFLLIVLSVGLTWPEYVVAQQYVDIDLNSPKSPQKKPAPIQKKTLPRQQKPAQKLARPLPQTAPIVQQPRAIPALPTTAPAPAARPVEPPTSTADAENSTDFSDDKPTRFKNRHGFTVDYTTWYETLKLTNLANKNLTEGNSHYFGVSFNYDFTVYRERWGFALNVGAITGNAQAGTKDSGDYYERRIVWTGFRGGGRLFWRANNRIDLGLGFLAQSKSTKWPEEENYVVISQANPHYFYYLDTRWRLNYRYELVQSFGTHLRSYALAWMLGLTYTLN